MELVEICLYVRVNSEGVVSHEASVWVIFGGDWLGMSRDIWVMYPVNVGVGAVDQGLGVGVHYLRVVMVLVPELRFSSLLLVFLLDGCFVVWRWTI